MDEHPVDTLFRLINTPNNNELYDILNELVHEPERLKIILAEAVWYIVDLRS